MCKNGPNGPNGPKGPKKASQILLAIQLYRCPMTGKSASKTLLEPTSASAAMGKCPMKMIQGSAMADDLMATGKCPFMHKMKAPQ